MQVEKHHTIQTNLLLLLIAIIWGFGFVAQRIGMHHMGPFSFNGLRFLLGGCCLIPLCIKQKRPSSSWRVLSPYSAGILAGLVLFAAATLQQIGLQYTTAGKAGFITGLYVVLVPLLGLFLKQRSTTGTWLGAISSCLGLYLLSVTPQQQIATGDLLELLGALCWALHVLLLAYLSPRTDPLRLAQTQFFVCGLCSLFIGISTEALSLQDCWSTMIPLLYGGVCSVGAGYTLQVIVQQKAHPAHAAILLSLESPFAALGGWLFLGEMLSFRGVTGCAFMFSGMLLSQLWPQST